MRITKALIQRGRSRAGSWSREQLALLGVPWPPEPGWRERVIFQWIPDAVAAAFLELKDAHLPPVEQQPSLFEVDDQ